LNTLAWGMVYWKDKWTILDNIIVFFCVLCIIYAPHLRKTYTSVILLRLLKPLRVLLVYRRKSGKRQKQKEIKEKSEVAVNSNVETVLDLIDELLLHKYLSQQQRDDLEWIEQLIVDGQSLYKTFLDRETCQGVDMNDQLPQFLLDYMDLRIEDSFQADQPKKKQKLTKNTPLTVVGEQPTYLTQPQIHTLLEVEMDLCNSERAEQEKSNAKNALEEYIYHMRDQLSDKLAGYIVEAEADTFRSNLTKMEDWLYEDGEDESKSVYVAKLAELQKVGQPIQERFNEKEARGPAMDALRDTLLTCRQFLAAQKAGEEKYAHISEEEVKPVQTAFDKAEAYLNTAMSTIASQPKHEDPKIKASAVQQEVTRRHSGWALDQVQVSTEIASDVKNFQDTPVKDNRCS